MTTMLDEIIEKGPDQANADAETAADEATVDAGAPADEANVDAEALLGDDQASLDMLCSELSQKPHLALPLLDWMIPELTFAPAKSLTGPGSKRFVGKIGPMNPQKGYTFLKCPEATERFGTDVFLHWAQCGLFEPDQEVDFAVLLNKDGKPQAFDLTPAGSAYASSGQQGWQKGEASGQKGGQKGGWGEASLAGKGDQAWEDSFVGSITAFNPEKGYGFIQCPETFALFGKDVWVHHAQVGNFAVGDSVSFRIVFNKDGNPQAIELKLASAKAGSQPVGIPKGPVSEGAAGSERYVGTIIRLNPEENGFGFIECPETFLWYGKDIYVHKSQVGAFAIGDTVSFALSFNTDGNPKAIDVKPASAKAASQPVAAAKKPLAEAAARSDRCVGTIKNFFPEKACGFIQCPETFEWYGRDVYVHENQLGRFAVGDTVSFTVILSKDGHPQADGLKPASAKAASQPAPSAKGPMSEGAPGADRCVGTVKNFFPDKGCGFIHCPETFEWYGKDVFVHETQIGSFVVGDTVSFALHLNKDGNPQATDLKPAAAKGASKPTVIPNRPTSAAAGSSDRFVGSITSFNAEKGYGFIECPETFLWYGKDVYVNKSQVGSFANGDMVSFTVVLADDGKPQAVDLRSAAAQGANQSAPSATRPMSEGALGSDRCVGTVKNFFPEKACGFIHCPETFEWYGKDVYVHESQIGSFVVGDIVSFALHLNKDGNPQATDVRAASAKAASQPAPSAKRPMSEAAASSDRCVGSIKNFFPDKACGFIQCPETFEWYGRDVYVHEHQLGRFAVGDTVSFTVILSKDGHPQADDLKPASAKAASQPAPSAKRPMSEGAPGADRCVGTVKNFFPEKGCGFIQCPEIFSQYGKDVYVHEAQIGKFVVGDSVSFTLVFNNAGNPQAIDLKPVSAKGASKPTVIPNRPTSAAAGSSDRFVGSITSFNAEKGYGFIQCPETFAWYGKDVYVHNTQVGNFANGDRVSFTVVLADDGKPQAVDLRSAAAPMSSQPTPSGRRPTSEGASKPVVIPNRPTSAAAGSSDRCVGSIKSFFADKGFGFIHCPETFSRYGKDIWVHAAQVGSFGVGDAVSFTLILNKDGNPQAIDLKPASAQGGRQQNGGGKRPLQQEAARPDRHSGVIKKFTPDSSDGYGFITCPEVYSLYGKDVWVHGSQFGGFSVGDHVSFTLILSEDGKPQGIDLRATDGRAAKTARHI
eukprot:TRINITY_DN2284_c0_g2_i3.p1 TRINITY_DN2284_c0_g2~~TRINITY_DN2284_c0_g2_i3.p1  ORF type:complete len:1209 (+),score=162.76 TRINITY_DN2284_c0_g2_i3:61-3687(+)